MFGINPPPERTPNMFGMSGIWSWVPLVNPWNISGVHHLDHSATLPPYKAALVGKEYFLNFLKKKRKNCVFTNQWIM